MKAVQRFNDSRKYLEDFMDEILAVCPRCSGCATISAQQPEGSKALKDVQPRRVVCLQCGFSKEGAKDSVRIDNSSDPVRDPYFQLPLWYQTACCGHILWAFNLRHLSLMQSYVGANLREHTCDPRWGWSNQSLVNRLPEWMIVGNHREAVLKGLLKLRKG
jgi:hypothetical protein